jgi:flagellin
MVLHIGLNSSQSNLLDLNASMDITAMTSAGLGIDGLGIADRASALTAVDTLGTVGSTVAQMRVRVSTVQEKIAHTVSTLDVAAEGLIRADSVFRETDMGEELAEMTKNRIVVQASTAMLGQANLMPRAVLSLIR